MKGIIAYLLGKTMPQWAKELFWVLAILLITACILAIPVFMSIRTDANDIRAVLGGDTGNVKVLYIDIYNNKAVVLNHENKRQIVSVEWHQGIPLLGETWKAALHWGHVEFVEQVKQ